jgi:hypothetical protein
MPAGEHDEHADGDTGLASTSYPVFITAPAETSELRDGYPQTKLVDERLKNPHQFIRELQKFIYNFNHSSLARKAPLE